MTDTSDFEHQWDLGRSHANLCILIDYMVEDGATPDDLALAVEKPWKFNEVLFEALQELTSEDFDTAEDLSPEAGHHWPDDEE
jgi:hypothetical protein